MEYSSASLRLNQKSSLKSEKIVFFSLILTTLASNIEASVVFCSVICGKMKLAGVVVSDVWDYVLIKVTDRFGNVMNQILSLK